MHQHPAFGGVASRFGAIRGPAGRFKYPGRGVHPTLAGDATPRRCGSRRGPRGQSLSLPRVETLKVDDLDISSGRCNVMEILVNPFSEEEQLGIGGVLAEGRAELLERV